MIRHTHEGLLTLTFPVIERRLLAYWQTDFRGSEVLRILLPQQASRIPLTHPACEPDTVGQCDAKTPTCPSAGLPTYHGADTILLFHFLLQLFETGFHSLMKWPQCFSDFVSMNPDPFSQKRNLKNIAVNTPYFLVNGLERGVHTRQKVALCAKCNCFVSKSNRESKSSAGTLPPKTKMLKLKSFVF